MIYTILISVLLLIAFGISFLIVRRHYTNLLDKVIRGRFSDPSERPTRVNQGVGECDHFLRPLDFRPLDFQI